MTGMKRGELIRQINKAFDRRNIRRTARRVARLGPQADFLTIFDDLGVIALVSRLELSAYRRVLKIPSLNRRILTAAFRAALFGTGGPTPLRFHIFSGDDEAVEVTTTDRLIDVVLIRVDPPGLRTPRPKR
jgi:hypothetical protein